MKYNLRAGDDDERQAHTRHFLKAPNYAIFLIFRMTWMAKLQNPFKSTVFFLLKKSQKKWRSKVRTKRAYILRGQQFI